MEFTVQTRAESGKSINRRLRVAGKCSGIIYGISDPLPIQMLANKAMNLIETVQSSHPLFDIKVEHEDGKLETRKVILQEYQKSPFKNLLYHLDFREVTDTTVLKMVVPIHVMGVSKAVKLGGTMQIIRHEILVTCMAKDIPSKIDVDVTELTFGGSIHVLDIPYPEGVKPIVSGRNFTLITLAGRMKQSSEEEEATTTTS